MQKYKKNSRIDSLLRSLAVRLGFIKGKQLVSVFSKSMIVDLQTPGISKAIFCENYREIDHTNIYSQKLTDKKKILDLGSNIGYYMLEAATDSQYNSEILCIEPDPRNLEILNANIKNNDLQDRVSVLSAVVTGETGRAFIRIKTESNLNRIDEKKLKDSVEVLSFSLDAIQEKYGKFDCLRMDVEGAESVILSKNCKIFLNAMEPGSLIFMEVHPGLYLGGENTMSDAMNKLNECGFNKFEIVTSGKKRAKKILDIFKFEPINIFQDGSFKRYHYSNVCFEDAKSLVIEKPKIIRYLIAEKK